MRQCGQRGLDAGFHGEKERGVRARGVRKGFAERLHEALGDLPPAEYEHLKYQDRQHPNAVRQITEPPTDPGSFTSCQPALRAASSMEASMLSKFLLSIVSITGPVSRPMGPPLGTYR